jgi:predicted GIY-YIG superfamily endonuclease
MQMYVYLIHFKNKLHHAGHYIGFSKCLDFRIAAHREGTGAKLIRAITRLGIPWIVIRTWRVDGQGFERYLKNQKHGPRFCPLCNRKVMDFQNEYVGGDDFCSEFLDETLGLKDRLAFSAYVPSDQPSRKVAVA